MPRSPLTSASAMIMLAACSPSGSRNEAAAPKPAAINSAAASPAPLAPAAPANITEATAAPDESDAAGDHDQVITHDRYSCAAEIGMNPAMKLVEQCIEVSPATRPPCNTANSCAMIREEIERGCGLLEEDAPGFCPEGQ